MLHLPDPGNNPPKRPDQNLHSIIHKPGLHFIGLNLLAGCAG